jgi:hypothetical protein
LPFTNCLLVIYFERIDIDARGRVEVINDASQFSFSVGCKIGVRLTAKRGIAKTAVIKVNVQRFSLLGLKAVIDVERCLVLRVIAPGKGNEHAIHRSVDRRNGDLRSADVQSVLPLAAGQKADGVFIIDEKVCSESSVYIIPIKKIATVFQGFQSILEYLRNEIEIKPEIWSWLFCFLARQQKARLA